MLILVYVDINDAFELISYYINIILISPIDPV